MRSLSASIIAAVIASCVTAAADVSPLAFWQSQMMPLPVARPLDLTTDKMKRKAAEIRAQIETANARAAARHNVPLDFMHRLTEQESGFRFIAGPPTKWGRAHGPHQILCSTAASLGERDCNRLMHDAERSAHLSARYVRMGYEATGSWSGAAAHYHGGPNTRLWGKKTRAYAAAVGRDRSFPLTVSAYAPAQGYFGVSVMPSTFMPTTY